MGIASPDMLSRMLNSRVLSRSKPSFSLLTRLSPPSSTSLLKLARDEDRKMCEMASKNSSRITPIVCAAAAAPIVTGMPATVLATAGPFFYMYLQASGYGTCKKIQKDGTTGSFSPAQFVSMYTNGAVWVLYGALSGDMSVLVSNSTATVAGLYYTPV